METPFLGGFEVSRSTELSDNNCINLFPTVVDGKGGKSFGAFYMAPGLSLLASLGTGPIRAVRATTNWLYVLSGNGFYRVSSSWASTLLGSVSTTSGPASILSNPSQVAVFDGASGSLWNGSTFSPISLPFRGPGMATQQDTFGFLLQAGSNQMWQSNAGDLSTWDALSGSSADAQPDQARFIISVNEELIIGKENTAEVWVDQGLPGFSFQRLSGVFIEKGCAAPYSVAKSGDRIFWLASSDDEAPHVVMLNGYKPERVSTHSIESVIQSYGTVSDATAFCYQQEGHSFYVLNFPTANATWVFDITTSEMVRTPIWHQRGAFSNGTFLRHWGNAFAFFNNTPVVGDYRNGNLYAFDLGQSLDNGTQRKWLRSWRAFQKPIYKPFNFRSLLIDMETGIGVTPGADPQLSLRWSDDGGYNWSNPMLASAGKTGQTGIRVRFNRLGATQRSGTLDRVFELSSSDAFAVTLINAAINE